jgi:hypothetical protein
MGQGPATGPGPGFGTRRIDCLCFKGDPSRRRERFARPRLAVGEAYTLGSPDQSGTAPASIIRSARR